MKLLKSAVVVSVIVLSIRKCWKRWSIAATDPSRFSNFATMELLKQTIINNRNLNPIARFMLSAKYADMSREAGITNPFNKKNKKKSSSKRKSSRNRTPG